MRPSLETNALMCAARLSRSGPATQARQASRMASSFASLFSGQFFHVFDRGRLLEVLAEYRDIDVFGERLWAPMTSIDSESVCS